MPLRSNYTATRKAFSGMRKLSDISPNNPAKPGEVLLYEEKEMSQIEAGQSMRADVPREESTVERYRNAHSNSLALHFSLNRLEDTLARAGVGGGRGPESTGNEVEEAKAPTLSEIAVQLPTNLSRAVDTVDRLTCLVERELT